MNSLDFELFESFEDQPFLNFIHDVAPEQAQFIGGKYFCHGKNYVFVAKCVNTIVGAIRYCHQKIGEEQGCLVVTYRGAPLFEAKINVFAVSQNTRNCGIGKAMQRKVIEHARFKGCYQVSSYSTYDKSQNYAVKLDLGFSVQPEKQADGTTGCYFQMRL
jgi:GNAT superfamily N-acetyltransferase